MEKTEKISYTKSKNEKGAVGMRKRMEKPRKIMFTISVISYAAAFVVGVYAVSNDAMEGFLGYLLLVLIIIGMAAVLVAGVVMGDIRELSPHIWETGRTYMTKEEREELLKLLDSDSE